MSHSRKLVFVLVYYIIVKKKLKNLLVSAETLVPFATQDPETVEGGPEKQFLVVCPLIWAPKGSKSAVMVAFLGQK